MRRTVGWAILAASIGLASQDSLSAQNAAIGSGVRKAASPRSAVATSEQAAPTLSPIQELHRRAYYQAIQSGYNPSQAKAHADAVAQRALATSGPSPSQAYVPAAQQAQQFEQQRIAHQQQMAVAQQNARLMQSLQRQRGVVAARAPQRIPSPMAAQPSMPIANDTSDAEARGVRAASAQIAKMQARSERIETAVESPAATTNNRTIPAPSSPRAGLTTTAPKSVLEPLELELPGPMNGAEAAATNSDISATKEAPPANTPAPPSLQGTPRVPRKLPNVDPQPLQRTPTELEVELEGFTDELLKKDGSPQPMPLPNQQVIYQQPIQSPSYARQDYIPSLGQENGNAAPPAQLVGRPTAPAIDGNVTGFAVEPVPGQALPPLAETNESSLNSSWQQQSLEMDVPPPTGIRVQPISSGGRRVSSPNGWMQDPASGTELQDVTGQDPSPRSVANQDELDDEVRVETMKKSCSEFRKELLGTSLRDISLDLSIPAENLPSGEAELAMREWRNQQDQLITRGRVVSATNRDVRIIEEGGQERVLPMADLSATDQKFVWDVLNLPFECEFMSSELYCRSFAPTHVAWHASNLCHKPLYFEDVQLERYGHSLGPIKQPFKSAAKFLVQAALLPYQTALYPPNECQYPLGLFRPGNCAPYLRTPFPWERRAIGYQAGVATGMFLLVP